MEQEILQNPESEKPEGFENWPKDRQENFLNEKQTEKTVKAVEIKEAIGKNGEMVKIGDEVRWNVPGGSGAGKIVDFKSTIDSHIMASVDVGSDGVVEILADELDLVSDMDPKPEGLSKLEAVLSALEGAKGTEQKNKNILLSGIKSGAAFFRGVFEKTPTEYPSFNRNNLSPRKGFEPSLTPKSQFAKEEIFLDPSIMKQVVNPGDSLWRLLKKILENK